MINRVTYALVCMTICGLLWSACTQDRQPCLTPKTANLILYSKHKTSDTATVFSDTLLPSAQFKALTPAGEKGFLYLGQNQKFSIPLSHDTGSCVWLFRPDTIGTTFDTITFYYRPHAEFLSNACGYTYFHTLDSVRARGGIIDSVHILDKAVTNNVNTTHLYLYIHPDY